MTYSHSHSFHLCTLMAALALAGITLFLGSCVGRDDATASLTTEESTVNASSPQPSPAEPLPQTLSERVLQVASKQLDIPKDELGIQRWSRETWMDGCLGLAAPDEFCTDALVEGWQLQVNHQDRYWFFRTDLTGEIVRLSEQSNNLPPSISRRLLEAASEETGIPVAELRVVAVEPQMWGGCLGLPPEPDAVCTTIGIPGWRVIVRGGDRSWIYHTNADGSEVRLNAIASSSTESVQLGFIPMVNPLELGDETIFQVSLSGGIAGQTEQFLLEADGRVLQLSTDPDSPSPTVIQQLSPQQIQQFTETLQQERFDRFNGIAYLPPEGAADYITVTFESRMGKTEYADMVQDRLPSELQQIVRAWNAIASQ